MEKWASLDVVGCERMALVVSLILVAKGGEYLFLRAADGTSNSE